MRNAFAAVVVSQHWEVHYKNPGSALWSIKDEWLVDFWNIVPNAGLNKILNDTYGTKSPDAAFAIGLVTGPGAAGCAAGDTMASHAGWTESTAYSNAGRPDCTFGAVASQQITNSSSPAVFNINATATIGGCFLVSGTAGTGAGQVGQKGGTGGTIRGAGAFSSGDKSVSNGGTLTVTVTCTMATA